MGNQQPSLVEGTKSCRVCQEERPIERFRLLTNRGRIFRSNRCLMCEAAQNREYHQRPEVKAACRANMRKFREKHPEHVRSQGRKWSIQVRERQRIKVYAAYGNKCVCCGESEWMFLSVDHINNDGYEERKTNPPGSLYGRLIREGFPKKYQLLCYNCNVGKHRNNGVCPHHKGSTTIPSGSTPQAIGGGSAKRPARRTKI